MRLSIDINVDLGEGKGNDDLLMPLVSSCNIACGGHFGDVASMQTAVRLAKTHRVKIGAHPSFPDTEHFGRKVMDMSCAALYATIKGQMKTFMGVIREEHAALHHVKPHGALYNQAAIDEDTAGVVIEVMKSIALPLKLYVPYKSVIADLAIKENIPIVYEAFADRNYNDDLTLVSRSQSNALIHDKKILFNHVYKMLMTEKVQTLNGGEVHIKADTFCIHGDNIEAVNLLRYLHKKLQENHIQIQ